MAKYDFHEAYKGPLGPHLNCLSRYTLTRNDADRLIGRSIRGAGKNTCKPRSVAAALRAAHAIEAHLLRHPHDKQSVAHLAKLSEHIGNAA